MATLKHLLSNGFPLTHHVFLIRGLPGSGKSSLARFLANVVNTDHWYEADMYFDTPDGYKFDPQQLGDAHDWCMAQYANAINSDAHCIIVSNTFSRLWEMDFYLEYAKSKNYLSQILTCEGKFQSIHNVPEETIKKMNERWERYV